MFTKKQNIEIYKNTINRWIKQNQDKHLNINQETIPANTEDTRIFLKHLNNEILINKALHVQWDAEEILKLFLDDTIEFYCKILDKSYVWMLRYAHFQLNRVDIVPVIKLVMENIE